MTSVDETALRAAFRNAIVDTVAELGMESLRALSMFPSNHRVDNHEIPMEYALAA